LRNNSYLNLVDYKARWYDLGLNRFVQPDTVIPDIGNPQSLNRYAYTLDNPVNHTDPTGHCAQASYKNKIVSDDQCEAQPGSDVPLTDKGKGKNEKCTRGDCDGLRMYKLYLYYLSHPGFWNNSNAANGFTPQQLDSYIKLIDLRSRWYDPLPDVSKPKIHGRAIITALNRSISGITDSIIQSTIQTQAATSVVKIVMMQFAWPKRKS